MRMRISHLIEKFSFLWVLVFSGLTVLVLNFIPEGVGISFLIPVFVFGLLASVTLVVGILGNERAVSKIWGDR